MFEASMVTFACVILAGALVVALLTTSASATTRRLTESLQTEVKALQAQMTARMPDTLAVQVDALAGALDALKSSNRREFGQLWGKLNGPSSPSTNGYVHAQGDADFQAMIALQQAGSAAPK